MGRSWKHWTSRVESPQCWAYAREAATRGWGGKKDTYLRLMMYEYGRRRFGELGAVDCGQGLVVAWSTGPERWLVRMRVVGCRVAVYCWPSDGREIEVEDQPAGLDALLGAAGPGSAKAADAAGAGSVLDAYCWRCAWCEDTLRAEYGRSVPLSLAPWLEDLRIVRRKPHLQVVVRAEPPLYRIGHGRVPRLPLFTEVVRLDGPPERDRDRLLAAVEPQPWDLILPGQHARTRVRWPPRSKPGSMR